MHHRMMNDNANEDDPSISQETDLTSEGQESGADEVRKPVGRRKDGRNYVQKNSLTEAELVAAREQTRSNLKRKPKTDLTEDDKKEDRRAANRLSAFQSRQRRKMIIEDLQKTVAEQSKHNADQTKEIIELKRQLQAARQENELMRHQMNGAGQGGGFGASQLFGGSGQMPGANPLLQLGQSQMGFQQNQLLQNAMLQNALLFSAQAQQQQQARGKLPNQTSVQQAGSNQANDTVPKAEGPNGQEQSSEQQQHQQLDQQVQLHHHQQQQQQQNPMSDLVANNVGGSASDAAPMEKGTVTPA